MMTVMSFVVEVKHPFAVFKKILVFPFPFSRLHVVVIRREAVTTENQPLPVVSPPSDVGSIIAIECHY